LDAIFLESQKMEPYFHVKDRNSQQKLLPTPKIEANRSHLIDNDETYDSKKTASIP
jgi:hypothetical protein